jgi:hypothetical protein
MRETRPSGSVEGVVSNHDPYSDWTPLLDSPAQTSIPAVVSPRKNVLAPRFFSFFPFSMFLN